jgi:hypothetical protein
MRHHSSFREHFGNCNIIPQTQALDVTAPSCLPTPLRALKDTNHTWLLNSPIHTKAAATSPPHHPSDRSHPHFPPVCLQELPTGSSVLLPAPSVDPPQQPPAPLLNHLPTGLGCGSVVDAYLPSMHPSPVPRKQQQNPIASHQTWNTF